MISLQWSSWTEMTTIILKKIFWEDFVEHNENTDDLYTIRDKSDGDVKDDTKDISISFSISNSRLGLFLFPTKYYRSIIIIYKN